MILHLTHRMFANDTFGLYCYGIGLTAKLQDYFAHHEHYLLLFSHIGDPRYAFLILYPLTYCLDNYLGLKVLWTSAITEWLNAVLKWIARDDRPYWWQSQDCVFSSKNLNQFPITCESGPGFPSGHVMSSSSLVLLLIIHMLKSFRTKTEKIIVLTIVVPLYIALIILVSLSRIYIATHFPHQVAAGAAIGICIALIVHNITSKCSPVIMLNKKSMFIGFTMLFIALLLYYLLMVFKLNPLSSVDLAIMHCKRKAWVHLDTTLFFAIIRDVGCLTGIGISTMLLGMLSCDKNVEFLSLGQKSFFQWIGSLLIGVFFCLLFTFSESFKLPQGNIMFFYFLAILKYIVYTCLVIVVEFIFRVKFVKINMKKTLYVALFFITFLLGLLLCV